MLLAYVKMLIHDFRKEDPLIRLMGIWHERTWKLIPASVTCTEVH